MITTASTKSPATARRRAQSQVLHRALRLCLLSSLLLGAYSAALARPPGGGGGQQRAFLELKQLERDKLAEELQLIEASRRCVEAAQNLRSLHDCHRREREAEWEHRERFHRRIESVRARYGIGPPRQGDRPPHRDGPPPPF